MRQGFLCTCNQKRNFSLIRQKTKTLPIDPIVKFAHFDNVMSIEEESDMSMGKFLFFLSDLTEISFLTT